MELRKSFNNLTWQRQILFFKISEILSKSCCLFNLHIIYYQALLGCKKITFKSTVVIRINWYMYPYKVTFMWNMFLIENVCYLLKLTEDFIFFLYTAGLIGHFVSYQRCWLCRAKWHGTHFEVYPLLFRTIIFSFLLRE